MIVNRRKNELFTNLILFQDTAIFNSKVNFKDCRMKTVFPLCFLDPIATDLILAK